MSPSFVDADVIPADIRSSRNCGRVSAGGSLLAGVWVDAGCGAGCGAGCFPCPCPGPCPGPGPGPCPLPDDPPSSSPPIDLGAPPPIGGGPLIVLVGLSNCGPSIDA